MTSTVVTNAQELAEALSSGTREIEVQGTITGSPMITLPPGAAGKGSDAVWLGPTAPDLEGPDITVADGETIVRL